VPEDLPPFLPVSARLFGTDPAIHLPRAKRAVDVVMPVYRHTRRTLDCVDSVLAILPRGSRLVVVEDRSPEPDLPPALDRLAAAGRIVLIRHDTNRGFPASANDGIAACPDRDVVLLNSDTLVPPGLVQALRRAAYSAPDIGSVTPFSNDASILSYPDHRARNPAPDLVGTTRLMALATAANGDAVVDIPTGNGFCMFLRRDCLDQVGLLREDLFAQGYGEENDWCLRARHLGWRHVGAPGAFVSHVGNVSFGAARDALMQRNLAVLNRLHPGYHALIADHVEADPLAPARRRLDLLRWKERRGMTGSAAGSQSRVAAPARAVLFITHDQGGGVERVVREQCRLVRLQGMRPILLRPDATTGVVRVTLSDAGTDEAFPNLAFALPAEFEALVDLLAGEGVQHVEWHHLLGHHPVLRTLAGRLGVPFDMFVHDYASFCPRIALVGPQGRYCGEPDVTGCENCIAIQGSNLDEDISVRALVARSAREFASARRVVAPSRDAAARITRHFPAARPDVVAWEDDRPDLSLERLSAVSSLAPRRAGEAARRAAWQHAPRRARLVVVGAIGREKGYDLLLACLAEIRARSLPLDIVVVGHTPDDDALLEAGCLYVTGEYREDDAVGLIRDQGADLAFLPSVWPETWCFTLSLAWRAGLPVACFDLGAPAERVRATRRGAVLPLGLPVGDLVTTLLRLCRPNVTAASSGADVTNDARQAIANKHVTSHHHDA